LKKERKEVVPETKNARRISFVESFPDCKPRNGSESPSDDDMDIDEDRVNEHSKIAQLAGHVSTRKGVCLYNKSPRSPIKDLDLLFGEYVVINVTEDEIKDARIFASNNNSSFNEVTSPTSML